MTCRVPVSCRFALSTSWDYLALLGNPTIRISLGLSRNFKPADKQTITLLLFTVQPRYLFIPEFLKFSQKFRTCFNLRADFVRSASSDKSISFHDPKQNRKFVTNLGGKGTQQGTFTPFPLFPFSSLPLPFNTIEISLKCYYSRKRNNVIFFFEMANVIIASINTKLS